MHLKEREVSFDVLKMIFEDSNYKTLDDVSDAIHFEGIFVYKTVEEYEKAGWDVVGSDYVTEFPNGYVVRYIA